MEQQDDFESALKFLNAENRHYVLDALACAFHNNGYALTGNTEQNDARWLAGILSERLDFGRRLEHAPEERQAQLVAIAEITLSALPSLADRIASRYIHMAGAMRAMERIVRSQRAQTEG